MAAAQNKKTMPEGMAKRFDPAGETGEPSGGEKEESMSGSFFGAVLGLKHIRAKQAQIHQARLWDSVSSPLGNGARSHLANFGDFRRSTQGINDFCIGHAQHLSRLRFITQAQLLARAQRCDIFGNGSVTKTAAGEDQISYLCRDRRTITVACTSQSGCALK